MKYLDEENGVYYTEDELILAAGDMSLNEYIVQMGYIAIEEEEEKEEESSFIEDVATNSADAASTNKKEDTVVEKKKTSRYDILANQYKNMDSNLDDISLESLEPEQTKEVILKEDKYKAYNEAKAAYEKYQETYTFGFGEGRGTGFNESNFLSGSQGSYNKNKALKRSLDDEIIKLGPNFDVPETLYELDEETFIEAFRKEYPYISIKETDAGDAVKILYDGKEEYLDLQPTWLNGDKYYKNFDKVIKEIKEFDKSIIAEQMISQITSSIMYGLSDGEYDTKYINEILDGTGYNVQQINKKGGKNTGMELLFNGEVVVIDPVVNKSGGSSDYNYEGIAIQNYLSKNLTSAQNSVVANKSYDLLDTFLVDEAKAKAEVNDNISDEDVKKAYGQQDFVNNVMGIGKIGGLTDAQNNILKNYLGEQQKKALTDAGNNNIVGGMARSNIGSRKNEVYDFDIATNLKGLLDVEGGEAILNVLQTEDVVGQLEKLGLENTRKRLIDNKMLSISEKLMQQDGNEDLIRLAQRYKYAPIEVVQDKVEEKIRIAKNSSDNIEALLKFKTNQIVDNLPEGSEIVVDVLENKDGSTSRILSLKSEGIPNEKQKLEQNKTALELWKLQSNINRLESDRVTFIKNLITDIDNIESFNKIETVKDDKGNEFEVNKNVFDLAFKEYDGVDLIKKDLNDATAQIFLTIPTLLGADWALDEQRRLNKKNEYFQSNLTYDNLQGQGGLFALRTFAQQFPNIALAITTAGAGSYAQLGNIGTRLAIGGAFGTSSGAQTFRDLTLQQELVEKAFEQKEFLEQGFEDGEITYFPYIQGMLDANKAIAMNDLTDDQIIGAAIASGTIEGSITAALGTAPNAIKIFKDFKGGINLVDLYAKTKKSQIAAILGEGTKRVGVEVAEELLIYGAQGVITEIGILNREFKADQFDDIAITTIMVAGASNDLVLHILV